MPRPGEALFKKAPVNVTHWSHLRELASLIAIRKSNRTAVSKDHSGGTSKRKRAGSMRMEPSAALIEDPSLQASLQCLIAGLGREPALQEDLMQESLVHLWRVGRDYPGRTRSWYLQSCRYHVQHWLASGRSVDSPKRAQADKRLAINGSDCEAALPEYHTNGEVFEAVSFRDVVSTLARHLKPRERVVLWGLVEGRAVSEIASKFGISRPTVIKYRRTIAALTIKLGAALSNVSSSGLLLGGKRESRDGSPSASAAVDHHDDARQAA